jgi:hypothetical protein
VVDVVVLGSTDQIRGPVFGYTFRMRPSLVAVEY